MMKDMSKTARFFKFLYKYGLVSSSGFLYWTLIQTIPMLIYIILFVLKMYKDPFSLVIVPFGIIGATFLNSGVANMSLFSIIKNVLNHIPTKELSSPFSGWMIISTIAFMAIWNVMLAIQSILMGDSVYFITLCISTWFLYSIGFGLCAVVIGVTTNYIIHQSTPGKTNDDIKNIMMIYDRLCSFAGPHLFATLATSTLRTTLAIFGTINVLQCKGYPYISLAVSYFCMMIMDAHIIMYYCLALHKCQSLFKGMASDLRTKLYTTKDPEEVKETTILIQEIEAAPPVTAMDYFEVNKGTISTILGITVSYCIVMFQTVSCQ